jgi:SAM-dependent methyltransferase
VIKLDGWKFADPVHVTSPDDGCCFYHTMDLPSGVTVSGYWDLRGRFGDYLGGADVRGKSVLDVGAATGWISFECERHGAAEVVGLDKAHSVKPQYVPGYRAIANAPEVKGGGDLRRGYWLCHRLYGSKAKIVYGDAYKVGDHITGADIVIVGQILVHCRDPLAVLHQCAKVAGEALVIVEGSFEFNQPAMVFLGGGEIYYSWFHLSDSFYRKYLDLLGFEVISMSKNAYRCNHEDLNGDVEVWTIVARRVGPTME